MWLLAYVTGLVNQELRLQNEYLAAENQILKAHLGPGCRLSNGERRTLAEIGKRLGRQALQQVASVAQPDTILAWYRQLIAQKFAGSKQRRSAGRAPLSAERENLVVRLARENSGGGYDRIVGALSKLGTVEAKLPVSSQVTGKPEVTSCCARKVALSETSHQHQWVFGRDPSMRPGRCQVSSLTPASCAACPISE